LKDALAGRRALVHELGIEPRRRFRELHQAILEQDPRLDLPDATRLALSSEAVRLPAIVGRDRELGELIDGRDDAFAGHGRLFLRIGGGKPHEARTGSSRGLSGQ